MVLSEVMFCYKLNLYVLITRITTIFDFHPNEPTCHCHGDLPKQQQACKCLLSVSHINASPHVCMRCLDLCRFTLFTPYCFMQCIILFRALHRSAWQPGINHITRRAEHEDKTSYCKTYALCVIIFHPDCLLVSMWGITSLQWV